VTLTNCTVTGNFTKGDNASGGAIHPLEPVVLINTPSGNSTGAILVSSRGNNAPAVRCSWPGPVPRSR
jgi:hypothetical protein